MSAFGGKADIGFSTSCTPLRQDGLDNRKNFCELSCARPTLTNFGPTSSSLGLQGFLQQPAYATALGLVFRIVGRHHSTSWLESTRARLRERRPYNVVRQMKLEAMIGGGQCQSVQHSPAVGF